MHPAPTTTTAAGLFLWPHHYISCSSMSIELNSWRPARPAEANYEDLIVPCPS